MSLTPEQEQRVAAMREEFGDRAADALATSIRATEAFNAASGGDFTVEAWAAGINVIAREKEAPNG